MKRISMKLLIGSQVFPPESSLLVRKSRISCHSMIMSLKSAFPPSLAFSSFLPFFRQKTKGKMKRMKVIKPKMETMKKTARRNRIVKSVRISSQVI